ncbi:MAG: thioesterase domain-containing protein [Bacteroides thetaiotaomicron]|nr:thioesterase domain-containing protein [Bacteroides thetaiotaomicron]
MATSTDDNEADGNSGKYKVEIIWRRGTRYREAFYDDIDELADNMFSQLKQYMIFDRYALFGYSMDSISLVEVLKRIIATELPLSSHVFLAAHEPSATKSELRGFISGELDEWVKEQTIRFGAVPDRLLNNKAFWRIYLPIYRADYSIIGKYDFKKLDLNSDISATVFFSETDTPLEEMKLWEIYFKGSCEFCKFEGTHFFIWEHHAKTAEIIKGKMVINT